MDFLYVFLYIATARKVCLLKESTKQDHAADHHGHNQPFDRWIPLNYNLYPIALAQ